jgi:hypothetical protein
VTRHRHRREALSLPRAPHKPFRASKRLLYDATALTKYLSPTPRSSPGTALPSPRTWEQSAADGRKQPPSSRLGGKGGERSGVGYWVAVGAEP